MSAKKDPNVSLLLKAIRGARTLTELDVLEDLASPWWPAVRQAWEERKGELSEVPDRQSRRSR